MSIDRGTSQRHALGVDFGTSNTVAVARWPDGRARPILIDGSPLLPTRLVNLGGSDGIPKVYRTFRLVQRVIGDDQFMRLTTFHNVLITGHQAFFTAEALTNIADTTIANITAFESGTGTLHRVSADKIA